MLKKENRGFQSTKVRRLYVITAILMAVPVTLNAFFIVVLGTGVYDTTTPYVIVFIVMLLIPNFILYFLFKMFDKPIDFKRIQTKPSKETSSLFDKYKKYFLLGGMLYVGDKLLAILALKVPSILIWVLMPIVMG